jgi:hypothetical protein
MDAGQFGLLRRCSSTEKGYILVVDVTPLAVSPTVNRCHCTFFDLGYYCAGRSLDEGFGAEGGATVGLWRQGGGLAAVLMIL